MLQDLKNACRELLKNRWFTCITVLTLALGIGANTAIFAVVNRLLLNPLPYPDSERIVFLRLGTEQRTYSNPTPALVAHTWREQARSLDGIEVFEMHDVLAYDDRGARLVRGMRITPGLPAFLGVTPVLGRSFSADDAAPGAAAVVLLSYQSWQRDYAGARDVLGRAIRLDDVSHVVIGVMPARWDAVSGAPSEVWLPLVLGTSVPSPGAFQAVEVLSRLRPGVPVDAVTSELDALYGRAMQEVPGFLGEGIVTRVEPPRELPKSTRDALVVLLAAVGLVLLVACSNVANLLLARGASRARAFALRAALGASTWRLARALLTECLVLALAAGAVGAAVGWLALTLIVRLRPSNLPGLDDVQLDLSVLVFTFGVSVATALIFGAAPIMQLASARFGDALRHGASGVVRRGTGARLRKLLVAAQMAISVVLLVSAGLLVRSIVYLQHVDVGFDTENLVRVQLSLPRAKYETPASRDVLSEQLLDRVRSLSGVASVTQAFVAPPNMVTSGGTIEIRGAVLSDADARASYGFNHVRPDFFSVLGIRLLDGRTFTADEMRSGEAVVVNRAFAERFWPEGNAVGAQIKWRDWTTVVGVVDNVMSGGLTGRRDAPQFYFPFQSDKVPTFIGATPGLVLIVRAAGDPADVIGAVRAAVQALDPEVAVANVLLTDTALANSIAVPRFNMALLTAFAVIALVLAAVGLAAVIGYEVAERTHEFGIRMALGARADNVRRLAMRQGLTPAFIGVAVGVIGALAATQLAASLLHGVAPRDPLTFVAVVALLVAVALGASWLPARRATRVDPIAALRAD